jgi:hypothetical protein
MASDALEVLTDALVYAENRQPGWWDRHGSVHMEFKAREDARLIIAELSRMGYELVPR